MEIMDSWKQINLGKSATLKARIGWQGLTTAEYLSSGDYYLVTGTDFLNGFIDWDNCVHVEKERYDQDKYIQLQVDDILVTKDGTIGKVAIVDKIVKPTTLNSGVFVIRPLGKSFYPKYLYYILRSGHFADFLSKLTAGSTINHLYQKDFVHYTFPAPPTLEEQRLIANTLSDTDILIQNLKTLILKKKAIKQGAMQELLTGKKRLKGFDEKWEEKRLGEVLSFQVGYPFLSIFFNDKEGIRLIKNRDLKNDGKIVLYSDKDFPTEYIVKNGDVLIGMDGDFIPCLWKKGKGLLNQRIGRLVSNKVDLTFFYYYLIKPLKDIEEITSSTTVKHLSHSDIEELILPIPSLQEQKAIAQILSDLDSEIEALETQLQKTQNLKQGMMQELLTGKIRLVKQQRKAHP